MPIARKIVQSRFARRPLDQSQPLYVLRRISSSAPVPAVGEVFNPAGIAWRRLAFMYRARIIGHELPTALRQHLAAKAAEAQPVEPEPEASADADPAPDAPAPPAAKPGRRDRR